MSPCKIENAMNQTLVVFSFIWIPMVFGNVFPFFPRSRRRCCGIFGEHASNQHEILLLLYCFPLKTFRLVATYQKVSPSTAKTIICWRKRHQETGLHICLRPTGVLTQPKLWKMTDFVCRQVYEKCFNLAGQLAQSV